MIDLFPRVLVQVEELVREERSSGVEVIGAVAGWSRNGWRRGRREQG
jgi:hypothetical protein